MPRRKGGDIVHGMINDADTLRWLAQQNCITPHVWNARCDLRDKPDRIVFDLDPSSEDDFDHIREGALVTAEILRDLGLVPFAKVSGSRGIHIIAPLKRTRTADEVRERAGELAERIAAERPDTLTTFWRKDKREGRILVDVARNTYGQTIVAPYAVRALAGRAGRDAGDLGRGRRRRRCGRAQFKLREHRGAARRAGTWADMPGSARPLKMQ